MNVTPAVNGRALLGLEKCSLCLRGHYPYKLKAVLH